MRAGEETAVEAAEARANTIPEESAFANEEAGFLSVTDCPQRYKYLFCYYFAAYLSLLALNRINKRSNAIRPPMKANSMMAGAEAREAAKKQEKPAQEIYNSKKRPPHNCAVGAIINKRINIDPTICIYSPPTHPIRRRVMYFPEHRTRRERAACPAASSRPGFR